MPRLRPILLLLAVGGGIAFSVWLSARMSSTWADAQVRALESFDDSRLIIEFDKLARGGDGALEILAAALGSPRDEVALSAQRLLESRVSTWRAGTRGAAP